MKASEYAQWFENNLSKPDRFYDLGKMFIDETTQMLREVTKSQSDEKMYDVFRQQHRKWRLLAKMVKKSGVVPGLNPDGYKRLVKSLFQELYDIIQWETI